MDYLFYGTVTATKIDGYIGVSVMIEKEPGEEVHFYEVSPDAENRLAYKQISDVIMPNSISASFTVAENTLFLLEIATLSNESDIPAEAMFAVYNTDMIHLPPNEAIMLSGATIISPDGQRFTTGG